MKIIKFNDYSTINESDKYPELNTIAKKIANEVFSKIDMEATKVKSEMPYKAQYILEEVIKLLEKNV